MFCCVYDRSLKNRGILLSRRGGVGSGTLDDISGNTVHHFVSKTH